MFVIPLYYKNSYQMIYLNTSAPFLFLQISLSVCLLQCSSCLCGDSPGDSCFWIEEETLMKNSINIYITKLSQMQMHNACVALRVGFDTLSVFSRNMVLQVSDEIDNYGVSQIYFV